MDIFSGLDGIVKTDYSLAKETWYGIGGPADYFIRPEDVEQLTDVVNRCNENDVPMYVLGLGSNLLISDEGVRGAVIQLKGDEFAREEYSDEGLAAGAGAELSKLVLDCVKKGLAGLETLTGIPGSVGGAVRMNAGGNFGDIGTVVESVTLMDKNGNIFDKSKPELEFDYRTSNITAKFILAAKIALSQGDPEQIMRSVKEIWVYKKNNQPLNTVNSGCIFKNPPGESAGLLIDKAELKGLRIGGAVVSEKHANFIIAEKGCTANDVMRLIDAVRERVKAELDVDLELEIEIWK
jgi:UDP-N-acetylmuramate dehydrogenase